MTATKKTILFIHRWLGFITGLVVFIISITGCIFCFQDELQDAFHSYRKVAVEDRPYLPPSVLKQTALKQHPGWGSSYIYYYGKDRPAAVLAYHKNELLAIYVNPYTGAITYTENPLHNFFTVVEYIHLYLLLPANVGAMVTGISGLLFLLIMITGIVLWWPKRRSDRKRSFTIKWNGRWRRVNYDLHNVLGFYSVSIAFILGITGLSIAFTWARNGLYDTANLGHKYPSEKTVPVSDTLKTSEKPDQPAVDKAFETAQIRSPKAEMFLIYMDDTKSGTIGITAYAQSLHYGHTDSYYFDKYTGKVIRTLPYAQKSPGMKLNEMNYDIHTGQELDLPGKIIAFLASLICASLPVTGFIIWLGKRKKKNPRIKSRRFAV